LKKSENGNCNILEKQFIFSTKETCDFFGISRETLSDWAKKGAPKEDRGKWDLKKLVEWRFGGGHKESPEIRKLKAEADLKEAKARQEQIKLGVTEEEFIQVKSVTADLRRLFTVLKRNLLAIGHDIATDLNSFDAEAALEAKKVVDKRIEEALEQMSRSGIYHERKR
jgi:phage terminase Nu1 subunit (DNA packaging protein)